MDAIKTALLLNVLIPSSGSCRPDLASARQDLPLPAGVLAGARLAALAGGAHPVHRAQRAVAERDGDRVSVRRLGDRCLGHRHSDRHRERTFPACLACCRPIIDTLQTLPSFVYLIPVVMLFRVGDFTAMIAIVLYASAPAVRYTAHGIRNTPSLIEAGTAAGCTQSQLLTKIRLRSLPPSFCSASTRR
jgi:hypothetical protein